MCGRFTNLMSWSELVEIYRLTDPDFRPNLRPRLDIRPTDDIVIVRKGEKGGRGAAMAQWWLVPPWVKEESRDFAMFNARADTVDQKKSFAGPFRRRRCLIPASGFYEWKDEGKGKRKTRHYITTKSGAPLTFAGLWELNEHLDLLSCTIIVTEANAVLSPIHNRMPVILADDDWDAWLAEPRKDLLCPAPEDDLVAYAVSSDIRDDDDPEVLAPRGEGRLL
jgi:putative SOS response-associated peptidase YedK